MLEDALLEVAQEDKYGEAEIANAGEILRVLRREIGTENFEEWVGRAAIFLQSKKVLLSWLHGEDEDGELQTEERESGEGASEENHAVIALRGMWEEWQDASTPHRRKPAEQLAGELDKTLLELSRETASVEKFMRCVREATKGEGFMPEALSADAENAERATLYEPMSALEENWAESSVKNALRAGASNSSHAVVLRGYPAQSGEAGEGAAADAPGSVGGSCGFGETGIGYWQAGIQCLRAEGENRPSRPSNVLVYPQIESCGAFCVGASPLARGIGYDELVSPTLKSANAGLSMHAVVYPQFARTLEARYDSSPCIDRGQNIVCIHDKATRKYIVRRLTPTECARLQGFPDTWGNLAPYDGDDAFWQSVYKTACEIKGTTFTPKKDLRKWYNGLRTDSAECRMWGNGIALPCAEFVLRSIVDEMNPEAWVY